LAREDRKRRVEEKHSDIVLTDFEEELLLLENLLKGPESGKKESTTRENTCSHMPSSNEEMILASEEEKVNFNFQIKLEDACIVESNEHEVEVASRLFPKEEIRPQIQHTKLKDFEEEMKFL